MHIKKSLQWILTVCFISALGANSILYAADYQVGSRLPKLTTKKTNMHDKYRTLEWEDLLPKGWDLSNAFQALNFDQLQDDDPKAMEALEKLRKTWDEAPIEPALNGKSIRISGFMIPLERSEGKISEFLLAPYFGACIHTPPPPANQLIHVIAQKPFAEDDITDDVTVSGVLHTQKMASEMGQSGYLIAADVVTPYTKPKRIQMFLNRGGIEQRIPRSR
ncbi:MAG: DUF3299 domain-containing protein [Methylococcaceae bacterium]|nr:DUF3299 domain-containing protein [Methylococcaceae bacterium]